ncbi:TetR/AcrR family transcriptional regulator [Flexithrix dorotheae]|uniref:TetR/AcrR family transcriptional regulator n=1 Tax=Flexithrix dorotheae TaxID=70993 RepID=UPI00037DF45E|nr:TetR/AcrR family transcriptional regulator [Flexithrix dorotheae]
MGRKAIDRKRKKNREKIQDWREILFPYFQEHGLKGITMDKLAEVLNKSKATVYAYFKTKEELLDFIISERLTEIRKFEGILENRQFSFLERYHLCLEHLAKSISGISNLFLSELKELHPTLWQNVEDFLDESTLILERFYKEGIQEGEFKNINPYILVMSDKMFFRTLTDPAFLETSGLSLQEAFEQYLQLKFFGLVK